MLIGLISAIMCSISSNCISQQKLFQFIVDIKIKSSISIIKITVFKVNNA